MALSTDKKLYIAVGVLVVLGGALYVQKQNEKEEQASYTLEGRTADLPKLEVTDEKVKTIDKIVLEKPAGDAGAATKIVLQKQGEEWQVAEPIQAKANGTNVKSLLDNLKTLKVSERIDGSKDGYGRYGLSDDKAVHATFFKGAESVADLYFGESGSRGQMTRIGGKDGVFALKGYSSFLYERDVKGWRDLKLFDFDDKKVASLTIENEHGTYQFNKEKKKAEGDAGAGEQETWSSKFKPAKAGAPKAIERFDENKVKDMLRSYKGLTADNFAEAGKQPSDVGLDKPAATVTITLEDGAKKVLNVGGTAEGSSRWVQKEGAEEIFSISSWSADWATAKPEKFQKADDKAKADDSQADTIPAHGMEPG